MERTEATLAPAADGVMVDLRCSVALIRKNRILLLHRAAHPEVDNNGDWVLPGGHPGAGESMRACAARETLEETGLRVDVGRCLFVYEIVGPEEVGRRVELVFAATAENFDELRARESDRHPELVELDDLPALDLRPPLAGHLRGLRFPQPTGAACLGNLWRPRRDAGRPVPVT